MVPPLITCVFMGTIALACVGTVVWQVSLLLAGGGRRSADSNRVTGTAWSEINNSENWSLRGTLSEHGTSVPIGSTVISGLKSRAPKTTNINLSSSGPINVIPIKTKE